MREVVMADRFDVHDIGELAECTRTDHFNQFPVVWGVTKYWRTIVTKLLNPCSDILRTMTHTENHTGFLDSGIDLEAILYVG